MWNAKRLWPASAASVAAVLALYLASPFGGTVVKGADIDQRLPAPLLDETPKGSNTETLILAGGCFSGCPRRVPTRARSRQSRPQSW